MKVSDITIDNLKEYAVVNHSLDDKLFANILSASKAYIKGYTGLDDETLDKKEDLAIALMILANEMYDNRAYTVDNDKANKIVNSILDMHSVNLL